MVSSGWWVVGGGVAKARRALVGLEVGLHALSRGSGHAHVADARALGQERRGELRQRRRRRKWRRKEPSGGA